MSDEELDWRAKFEAIANSEEMQVLEERIAAQHPTWNVQVNPDEILLKFRGDRATLGLNLPVEFWQSMIEAQWHILDHSCRDAAGWLNGVMQGILESVRLNLEKQGQMPRLPPNNQGH